MSKPGNLEFTNEINLDLDVSGTYVKVKEPLTHFDYQVFNLNYNKGDQARKASEGQIASVHLLDERNNAKTYIIEAATMKPIKWEDDFVNSTLVFEVIKHAYNVTICLVINSNELEEPDKYLALLTSVVRMLEQNKMLQAECHKFFSAIINC